MMAIIKEPWTAGRGSRTSPFSLLKIHTINTYIKNHTNGNERSKWNYTSGMVYGNLKQSADTAVRWQGCDFSRFFRIFWVASGFFQLRFVFLKPKKSHQEKKKKKSRANVIIISSDCEEETNIERLWNFRPDLTSVSVREVHIPDWFCCAQVGDREYRHICQHVKDGSIRSYRQGWRFVNWQGAQKPLEILMARGGTKYWRLTSYTQ